MPCETIYGIELAHGKRELDANDRLCVTIHPLNAKFPFQLCFPLQTQALLGRTLVSIGQPWHHCDRMYCSFLLMTKEFGQPDAMATEKYTHRI